MKCDFEGLDPFPRRTPVFGAPEMEGGMRPVIGHIR